MITEIKKLSRRSKIILFCLMAGIALLAVGSYKAFDTIEHDPQFCQSCHLMEGPYQKWREGPHHMVNCHSCHRQSKLDGLRQVWMNLTLRPKEVVHHPELDHTVCAQCHLSSDTQWKLIGETAGHRVHFERGGIECLTCHAKGIHDIVRPVDVCVECHSDKPGNLGKMAFAHCLTCHNFLGKGTDLIPTSEVCQGCHQKIQTEKIHPPIPKGKNCVDCHKSHD